MGFRTRLKHVMVFLVKRPWRLGSIVAVAGGAAWLDTRLQPVHGWGWLLHTLAAFATMLVAVFIVPPDIARGPTPDEGPETGHPPTNP